MKSLLLSSFALLGLLAGCQSVDLTPESDPQRAIAGNIRVAGDVVFPPDAVAVVRVIDLTPLERPRTAVTKELAVADLGHEENRVERVLGEQVIHAPGSSPFPFRVEFQADEATLRRGLNLDVRISQDGKVRYRTLSAHVVTLGSVAFPQEVSADPVR